MLVSDQNMSGRELLEEVCKFPVHYVFVLAAKFVASPYSKPEKTSHQLEIGDELVGWGVLAEKSPADYTTYDEPAKIVPGYRVVFVGKNADDPLPLETIIEAERKHRVGPETNWEKVYDFYERWSGFVGQRRRRGHVTYYVGPWNVYCYREGLEIKTEWIGFSRFRKAY